MRTLLTFWRLWKNSLNRHTGRALLLVTPPRCHHRKEDHHPARPAFPDRAPDSRNGNLLFHICLIGGTGAQIRAKQQCWVRPYSTKPPITHLRITLLYIVQKPDSRNHLSGKGHCWK
jgi:hypothetical protein